MSYTGSTAHVETGRSIRRGGFNAETLSGALTLTKRSSQVQVLDPGGAGRTVNLPAVSLDDDGYWFEIYNSADMNEALTVKDSGGSTIDTVQQNERITFYVDSAAAWQSTPATTIVV